MAALEHMIHGNLYLRFTTAGVSRVEDRPTWGEQGPANLFRRIKHEYDNEAAKDLVEAKKEGRIPRPATLVEMITREEYDRARFSKEVKQ